MLRTFRFVLTAVLLVATLGCGSKTAPVNGRVKFKDNSDISVLAGYEVAFEPADQKTSSVGTLNADGTFKLSTFGPDDGALPGPNRISITQPTNPNPDQPPPKSHLPGKYSDSTTSGLTADVKPGPNKVELELDRLP